MSNELTIRTNCTFKNERLNALTAEMAQNAAAAVNNVKAICSTLAVIEANQLYKDDGFKSLAEYAETIGLDKSRAHKMENAGRLINSEREKIKELAAGMDWSKLTILSSAGEDAIEAGIDAEEITPDMTQDAVRVWKDARKSSGNGKDKVLKRYLYAGIYIPANGAQVVIAEEATREDFIDNWFKGAAVDKKTATVRVNDKMTISRTLVLDENGNMALYREAPIAVENPAKSGKGMTDKQLAREIERYKDLLRRAGIDPEAAEAAEAEGEGE